MDKNEIYRHILPIHYIGKYNSKFNTYDLPSSKVCENLIDNILNWANKVGLLNKAEKEKIKQDAVEETKKMIDNDKSNFSSFKGFSYKLLVLYHAYNKYNKAKEALNGTYCT